MPDELVFAKNYCDNVICFSFPQVYVNTTEQIDPQNTYKLGLLCYNFFFTPSSTKVNLPKLQ